MGVYDPRLTADRVEKPRHASVASDGVARKNEIEIELVRLHGGDQGRASGYPMVKRWLGHERDALSVTIG